MQRETGKETDRDHKEAEDREHISYSETCIRLRWRVGAVKVYH